MLSVASSPVLPPTVSSVVVSSLSPRLDAVSVLNHHLRDIVRRLILRHLAHCGNALGHIVLQVLHCRAAARIKVPLLVHQIIVNQLGILHDFVLNINLVALVARKRRPQMGQRAATAVVKLQQTQSQKSAKLQRAQRIRTVPKPVPTPIRRGTRCVGTWRQSTRPCRLRPAG